MHGGLSPSEEKRLKQFEGKNRSPKRPEADTSLAGEMPQEAVRQKHWGRLDGGS